MRRAAAESETSRAACPFPASEGREESPHLQGGAGKNCQLSRHPRFWFSENITFFWKGHGPRGQNSSLKSFSGRSPPAISCRIFSTLPPISL